MSYHGGNQSEEDEYLTFQERMNRKKKFEVKEINGCFYPVDQKGNFIGNPPPQEEPRQPSPPRAPTPTFETDNAGLQERMERSQNRRGAVSQNMPQVPVPQVLDRQVVSLEESRVRPEVRAALNMPRDSKSQRPSLPPFAMEATPMIRPTRKEFLESQAFRNFQPAVTPKPRMKKVVPPTPLKTQAPKSTKVIAAEASLKARSWRENATRQPSLSQTLNQTPQAIRSAEHQAVQVAALRQQIDILRAENAALKAQVNDHK